MSTEPLTGVPQASNGDGRRRRKDWTREEIIAALQTSAAELGRTPKTTDWGRMTDEHPNFDTVYRVIGGWPEACEAAGLTPTVSTRRPRPVEQPQPEPVDPVGDAPSFADVAEQLEAAIDHVEEAEHEFDQALLRFKAHPLYQRIRREEG